MTELLTANIGGYPRVGEQKDQQRHRRGLTYLEQKDLSAHAFRDVEQSVTQEVIREQIEAGLDEVTNGQVTWADPISHVCLKLSGFKSTGLTRFFDTNFYIRAPLIVSKPKRRGPLLLSEFQYAQSLSHKPLRVVLTGPYTLARYVNSSLKVYQKFGNRLAFFTEVLAQEIKTLVSEGAALIQIDEPSIGQHPEDMTHLGKSLDRLRLNAGNARVILAVYFSPLPALYEALASLPIHVLNLDFTYDGKKLTEKIFQTSPKVSLGFGVLDARNTRLELIDPILNTLQRWIEKNNPSLVYLTPSAGLEYLPRDHALDKLKVLKKIKNECQNWIASKKPYAETPAS